MNKKIKKINLNIFFNLNKLIFALKNKITTIDVINNNESVFCDKKLSVIKKMQQITFNVGFIFHIKES
jgi:hypothetical protein